MIKRLAYVAAIVGGLISGAVLFPPAISQPFNPGINFSNLPANNDCVKAVVAGGVVQSVAGAGAPCANAAALPLTQNNVFVGSAGNLAVGVPLGGDCTIVAAGTITCTKTNGVVFAASATSDTTNAANISSGSLALARLALANGAIYIGSAGGNPAAQTVSQDCTITNAGVITCLKTNNVAFAASATTDTTNATNVSSGTLASARLPAPFTSGTRQGNTSSFFSTSGVFTNGNIVKTDVNGNAVDGGPGGSGTVTNVATAGLVTGGPFSTTGTVTVTAASKSDQTTGTSNVVAVTPLHQQDHDSAAKARCMWVGATAGTNACTDGYNVTNVTRNGTGSYNINFTTPFASANYECSISASTTGAGYALGFSDSSSTSASILRVNYQNSAGSAADPTNGWIICFGRQ